MVAQFAYIFSKTLRRVVLAIFFVEGDTAGDVKVLWTLV
jgi:hypothetical protein